jgi:MFS family permease
LRPDAIDPQLFRFSSMNRSEIRATAALSLIQALRMVGMFMILPVFSVYALSLPGHVSPQQAGLAFGVYGLVQALLQLPFGWWSDRWGRLPVIVTGLVLFAAGSFLAGATRDIHWIILGRALQGAGAISSAASALLADSTRLAVRTQAMALYGAGMGAAFILALVLGPVFDGWIGVNGIFRLTGALALLAIPLLLVAVPRVPRQMRSGGGLARALTDRQLLRLDAGIFLLHTMMTCLFFAAPLALHDSLGLPESRHWQIYLPILVASLAIVFPLIRRIESRGRVRSAFLLAIALLAGALLLAAAAQRHAFDLLLALLLFFVGFNYLEATLPSLISRRAPAEHKGTALGVYSSAQFLGGFAGSGLGGFALAHWGPSGAFLAAATLALPWLLIALGMQTPNPALHQDTTLVRES